MPAHTAPKQNCVTEQRCHHAAAAAAPKQERTHLCGYVEVVVYFYYMEYMCVCAFSVRILYFYYSGNRLLCGDAFAIEKMFALTVYIFGEKCAGVDCINLGLSKTYEFNKEKLNNLFYS